MRNLGWHFLREDGTTCNGLAVPEDSSWLEVQGELVMCENGLHWCRRAIDALRWAPSCFVTRVEAGGETIEDDEKCVSRKRRILWRASAAGALRRFARECAMSVENRCRLPTVVFEYLRLGAEERRKEAYQAILDAFEDGMPKNLLSHVAADEQAHALRSALCACNERALTAARYASWNAVLATKDEIMRYYQAGRLTAYLRRLETSPE